MNMINELLRDDVQSVYERLASLYANLGTFATHVQVQNNDEYVNVDRVLEGHHLEFPVATDTANDPYLYVVERQTAGANHSFLHQFNQVGGLGHHVDTAYCQFSPLGQVYDEMDHAGVGLSTIAILETKTALNGATNTSEGAPELTWSSIKGDEADAIHSVIEGVFDAAEVNPQTLQEMVVGSPIGRTESNALGQVVIMPTDIKDLRIPGNELITMTGVKGIPGVVGSLVVVGQAIYAPNGDRIDLSVRFKDGDGRQAFLSPEQRNIARDALVTQVTENNLTFSRR
jgi:hypothetical protein